MPKPDKIWVFFGLIATGKSFLAERWAARHEMAYLNSDRVRKELAGIPPNARREDSLSLGIYSSEFTRHTYDELLVRCEAENRRGKPVVLDASYQSRSERQRLLDLAARLGCEAFFVLCTCPDEEVRRRLEIRRQDPDAVSDGRLEIYLAQKKSFEPPDELAKSSLLKLSTAREIGELLAELDEIFEVESHV
jgi:predicted kinase